MNPEELKKQLGALLPSTTFEEGGEWVTIAIDPAGWAETARQLRSTGGLDFDYLFCVTAVDWKTHFTMVYHLTSIVHRHTLVVKIKLNRENPEIATVADIWRTAEFHEREAYDLMGVVFIGHPDLRRLFMTDDWQGWPLRKDYEDPVNMIKL
ncbi:NADH-quinone oxidoreductase subunit C [Puia sp.]|jgi:NADH/F420H2 dehydrogenase subunit C|uniref:NADH-quinone oxidoreductase subunit C n=1 Tax=Puia sp. TaxID=2045100 RepID=UPI002F3F6FDA